MVPALTESIKVAGLVLVKNTSDDGSATPTNKTSHHARPSGLSASPSIFPSSAFTQDDDGGVDGVLRANGVMSFHGMIDV